MKNKIINSLFGGFLLVIIILACWLIYSYVDETFVYVEIKDSINPREPYDVIDYIDLYGKASDGWYIANVFVIDSKTNNFSNSMIRYNRNTKEIVIPSESFGFESCVIVKEA